MDHALPVGVLERVGDLRAMPTASSIGSWSSSRSRSRSDSARHIRHDIEEHRPAQAEVERAGIVEREDVGMAEPGRDTDLAQEALGAEHRAELGVEHLDRDLAVMPDVVGQVDRGHAAAAELALEAHSGQPARSHRVLEVRHSGTGTPGGSRKPVAP